MAGTRAGTVLRQDTGPGDDSPAGPPALSGPHQGRFHRAFGLVPAAERPDVEDHVAAECEFMSALALKEAYARAENLREAATLPYDEAVADLLEAWTAADVRDLGAEPVALGGRCGFDPIQEEDVFSCPMACAEPPEDDGPGEKGQRSGP